MEEKKLMGKQEFSEISKTLSEGLNKISTVDGKDIILIIGNTGSGKSTSINYLLGAEMIEDSDGINKILRCINLSDERAKIGYTINSGTLYTEAYQYKNSNVFLCDCPGFGDTRKISNGPLIASISTEMAVNRCNRVSGVIVVISVDDLGGKGEGFRRLYETLSKLFKDITRIEKSILFVITKAHKNTKEAHVVSKIGEYIDSITSELSLLGKLNIVKPNLPSVPALWNKPVEKEKDEEKNDQINERQATLKILNTIKNNSNNIVILDCLESQSRENIFNKILKFHNTINKDEFNFSAYDNKRKIFDNLINQYIGDFSVKLKELLHLSYLVGSQAI